jgi:hypothetical protein
MFSIIGLCVGLKFYFFKQMGLLDLVIVKCVFLKDPTRVKRKKEYKAMQGQRVLKSQQTKAGKALNQAKGLAKSEFKNTSMTREGRAAERIDEPRTHIML